MPEAEKLARLLDGLATGVTHEHVEMRRAAWFLRDFVEREDIAQAHRRQMVARMETHLARQARSYERRSHA